jgi:CubicO group peptidase (beta-lactamase class C family)
MRHALTFLATIGIALLPIEDALSQAQTEALKARIERAKSLELDTPYVAPPGSAIEHHAAGYAKILCSAVFVTGLDADFAAENVGYFTAPYAERAALGKPKIDRAKRSVQVTTPGGIVRTAVQVGSQGCVALPVGANEVFFKSSIVKSALPDAGGVPWPMGDKPGEADLPSGIDRAKLREAIDAAFDPAGMTAAFLVTHKGRIIAEQYGEKIGATTPLESWSMGKSVTATLMGVLIQQGVYTLDQSAPIPEWQRPNDARGKIRIRDLLNMASGLRIRAPGDPGFEAGSTYSDHQYLYTGSVNSFHYAATRPLQWPPNTVGRYRNTDPVLANYLIRLAVEKRKQDYHAFPQRALFDRIGARSFVLDTDPYGNFLLQGYDFATARDWARLANLYLQDGVWNGERILPEGFAKFVATPAPAWAADNNPVYGGFFWLNTLGAFQAPKDAYYMAGAGGQIVLIVPTHQLAIVRLGHYKGAEAGGRALNKAIASVMTAIGGDKPR